MRHTFELTGVQTSLPELLDAVERLLVARTKSDPVAGEVRLITEEALTNVIKYGYESADRPAILAEVQLAIGAQDVVLEIRDRGAAFDPLSQPSPDLDAPPESKKEGGLGIHLLRSLADEVRYRREGDVNVLSLRKRIG